MWNTLQTLKKMDETENTSNSAGYFGLYECWIPNWINKQQFRLQGLKLKRAIGPEFKGTFTPLVRLFGPYQAVKLLLCSIQAAVWSAFTPANESKLVRLTFPHLPVEIAPIWTFSIERQVRTLLLALILTYYIVSINHFWQNIHFQNESWIRLENNLLMHWIRQRRIACHFRQRRRAILMNAVMLMMRTPFQRPTR